LRDAYIPSFMSLVRPNTAWELREMDINPLIVTASGAVGVDVKIRVAPAPDAGDPRCAGFAEFRGRTPIRDVRLSRR